LSARPSGSAERRAFTILEIVASILVILVITAFLLPNYLQLLASAQKAVCIANMRSLHTGLSAYLQDRGDVWPQGPPMEDKVAYETFWIKTLEQQGVPAKTWKCPTISGHEASAQAAGETTIMRMHYTPTLFDDTPGIARRWATQPWLIERADAHGQGPLLCFPDGSVQDLRRVLAGQTPL